METGLEKLADRFVEAVFGESHNTTSKVSRVDLTQFNQLKMVESADLCHTCHGSGFSFVYDMVEALVDCKFCNGSGYKIDMCLKCQGKGYIKPKNKMYICEESLYAVKSKEKIVCRTCNGTGEYTYRPNLPKHPIGVLCPHCTPKDENGRFISEGKRTGIPKGKVKQILPASTMPSKILYCKDCGGSGRKTRPIRSIGTNVLTTNQAQSIKNEIQQT